MEAVGAVGAGAASGSLESAAAGLTASRFGSSGCGGAATTTGGFSAGAGSAGSAGAGSTSGSGAGGSMISTTGGGGGFSRPSRSALRRTRSAWASTMLDEWDLTPILSAKQSSSVSWLVSPSSLASSWTRILPGKECPLQDCSARSLGPGAFPGPDGHASRSLSTSPGRTSALKARPNTRRRRAASRQAMSSHNHAPRPGPGPNRNPPPATSRTRRICALGRRVRQPMQVRVGLRRGPPVLPARRPSRSPRPRSGPGPWRRPKPQR